MTPFWLLLVITAAVRSAACPIMCTCQNHPRNSLSPFHISVDCNNLQFDLVHQLDGNTSAITIANATRSNLLKFLDDLVENAENLPHFGTLTITFSEISTNSSFVSNLTRLRSLNLPLNEIREIPDNFFTISGNNNVSGLESLDLSWNSLESLEDSPFRTLRNLEVLNLSANMIGEITPASLVGLKSLKCLDLSANQLKRIAPGALTSLLSIQHMNLSNNRLEILKEQSFTNLPKLQQLDVSFNRLNQIDLQLQLPNLTRFILTGNLNLREDLLVGTGQKLQILDASKIGLKKVPAALTHSIRTLRLAENSIKTVRCGDLDSYPLLQLLDIALNHLEVIEDDALGRLDSLSILYLTKNSMETIPKSLSEKLTVLHLENNFITNITRRDLQGLTSLQVLLLNDNKIRIIEEDAFGQLGALLTLDLSRNPLKALGIGSLSGPLTLQTLRLSQIDLLSPAPPVELSFPLQSTEHLITLDLNRSPELAHQLLIDTAALAASKDLQELDLTSTEIEFVRSDLIHYLPQLRVLKISENPINCTQLEWLGAWMRRQDDSNYRKVVCNTPRELSGTPLIDLQEIEVTSTTTARITTTTELTNELPLPENLTNSQDSLPQVTSSALQLDSSSAHRRWNASTGELLSIYSHDNDEDGGGGGDDDDDDGNDEKDDKHHAMFVAVLAVTALGAAAILTILAARLTLKRHHYNHNHHHQQHHLNHNRQLEEVEVGNLPGVTELW